MNKSVFRIFCNFTLDIFTVLFYNITIKTEKEVDYNAFILYPTRRPYI